MDGLDEWKVPAFLCIFSCSRCVFVVFDMFGLTNLGLLKMILLSKHLFGRSFFFASKNVEV